MKRHITMALLLCLMLSGNSALLAEAGNPRSEIAWQPATAAIFALAQQRQKLVFLDLTAEWCQFCKQMDQTTYRDPDVISYINEHFVAARVNDVGQGDLVERYRHHARPGTVMMLNGEGREILHKRGFLNAQLMQWMLLAVVQNPSPEEHQ